MRNNRVARPLARSALLTSRRPVYLVRLGSSEDLDQDGWGQLSQVTCEISNCAGTESSTRLCVEWFGCMLVSRPRMDSYGVTWVAYADRPEDGKDEDNATDNKRD